MTLGKLDKETLIKENVIEKDKDKKKKSLWPRKKKG